LADKICFLVKNLYALGGGEGCPLTSYLSIGAYSGGFHRNKKGDEEK
jgi:hypothetical protein